MYSGIEDENTASKINAHNNMLLDNLNRKNQLPTNMKIHVYLGEIYLNSDNLSAENNQQMKDKAYIVQSQLKTELNNIYNSIKSKCFWLPEMCIFLGPSLTNYKNVNVELKKLFRTYFCRRVWVFAESYSWNFFNYKHEELLAIEWSEKDTDLVFVHYNVNNDTESSLSSDNNDNVDELDDGNSSNCSSTTSSCNSTSLVWAIEKHLHEHFNREERIINKNSNQLDGVGHHNTKFIYIACSWDFLSIDFLLSTCLFRETNKELYEKYFNNSILIALNSNVEKITGDISSIKNNNTDNADHHDTNKNQKELTTSTKRFNRRRKEKFSNIFHQFKSTKKLICLCNSSTTEIREPPQITDNFLRKMTLGCKQSNALTNIIISALCDRSELLIIEIFKLIGHQCRKDEIIRIVEDGKLNDIFFDSYDYFRKVFQTSTVNLVRHEMDLNFIIMNLLGPRYCFTQLNVKENLSREDRTKLNQTPVPPPPQKQQQNYDTVCLSDTEIKLSQFDNNNQYNQPYNHYQLDLSDKYPWSFLFWAILSNKLQLAFYIIVKCDITNKLSACLFACYLSRRMAQTFKKLSVTNLERNFLANANRFEEFATNLLNEIYKIDKEAAVFQVENMGPRRFFGSQFNLLRIAEDAKALRFLEQACIQAYVSEKWQPGKEYRFRNLKQYLVVIMLPVLLALYIIFYPIERILLCRECDEEKNAYYAIWKRSMSYLKTPSITCVFRTFWYAVFLSIYTRFLIVDLAHFDDKQISLSELLTYLWVIGLLFDEIYKILKLENSWYKQKNWGDLNWFGNFGFFKKIYLKFGIFKFQLSVKDHWNMFDIISISLFIISTLFRFTFMKINFVGVRVMFSITIIFFYMKLLRFAYAWKSMGPVIFSILRMIKSFFEILFIMVVFLLSFGIGYLGMTGKYSRQYTSINFSMNFDFFYNVSKDIVEKPFWRVFGELFLDDIREEADRYSNEDNNFYRAILPMFVGIYMIVMNALLFNLLIAVFNHSYDSVREQSAEIWALQRISLLNECEKMPWCPSPFNIIWYLKKVFLYCWQACKEHEPIDYKVAKKSLFLEKVVAKSFYESNLF